MSSEKMQADNDNGAGDLLLGADAIATYLGITRRQAYRLADGKVLPSFKAGGTVAARKSSLMRWMAEAEQRGVAA